jgi:hypothetical protein
MMGHIEAMSRDTALMEILGPNPAAFMRWLKDTITKSAELDVSPGSKAVERAKAGDPEDTAALRRDHGRASPPRERAARARLLDRAIAAVGNQARIGDALGSADGSRVRRDHSPL